MQMNFLSNFLKLNSYSYSNKFIRNESNNLLQINAISQCRIRQSKQVNFSKQNQVKIIFLF